MVGHSLELMIHETKVAMSFHSVDRRTFLGVSAAGLLGAGEACSVSSGREKRFPPTRVITRGPKHHWFGYYDKLQFDPTSRYVLGMEVDFEHRSPRSNDVIKVGMVDLLNNDQWIELGESRAWCWQQGCMLQWLPGSTTKVLWNDRQDGRFVCHVLDVMTNERRTIPNAVYAVSPNGKSAVSLDFGRVNDVRPGSGYAGLEDLYAGDLAPQDTGVFHVDLLSGESKLIIPIADIVRMGAIPYAELGIKHYFNHLLFSPDGSRFIALHRWRYPNGKRLTRLITANPDGSDIRFVIPNGYASHFIWRDPQHILSQSRKWLGHDEWSNYLFEDKEGGTVEHVGLGVIDFRGHLSYLPGNEWILNDTYPQGPERFQTPHLYHVNSNRRIDLGYFHLPKVYTGEWRVDTHPRFSPDSQWVCIDAPHGNEGRQLQLIDISSIVT